MFPKLSNSCKMLRIFEAFSLGICDFISTPCKTVNSEQSVQLKFFDLHKLFKRNIVQHESCRKLSGDLTIKIWIILDNWFESYGQNTPSLDTQFSWLTSLWIPEHITSLDSELILVITRWIVPYYHRNLV